MKASPNPQKQRTSELLRRSASELKLLANKIPMGSVEVRELFEMADELCVRATLIEMKHNRVSSKEEIELLEFIDSSHEGSMFYIGVEIPICVADKPSP